MRYAIPLSVRLSMPATFAPSCQLQARLCDFSFVHNYSHLFLQTVSQLCHLLTDHARVLASGTHMVLLFGHSVVFSLFCSLQISDRGAQALLDAVERSLRTTHLGLHTTGITYATGKSALAVMRKNSALQEIDMRGNCKHLGLLTVRVSCVFGGRDFA